MGMPQAIHRFTVDEFQRMGQAGVFHEDDRVELIDGQVIEMTPIGPRHAACVDRLTRRFSQRVGERAIVRVQNPVVTERHGQPQPDVALLRPPLERYADAHPEPPDILLVIEVAETSVAYDRQTKIPGYARAGIAESWLVDLPAGRIEVYRSPARGRYTDVTNISRGGMLSPLALPEVHVGADEILG